MPRRCTICFHDSRDEIDRQLSGGGAISEIGAKYGVSVDAIKRHKANHLLPEMREQLAGDENLRDVDVLAEMRSLYRRMRTHLEAVEDTDNWQAIRAFHSEARRDLELLAKLLGELSEAPIVDIHIHPEWVQLRTVIVQALEAHPQARNDVIAAIGRVSGNGR